MSHDPATDTPAPLLRPVTLALIVCMGLVAFLGMVVLGTFAPDLQNTGRPGGHALSRSGIGFSGIVQLASATGRNPQILRDDAQYKEDALVVAAPEAANVNISKLSAARSYDMPTLFIFPKWEVVADREHRGWVRKTGLLEEIEPEGVFAPAWKFHVERRAEVPGKLVVADPQLKHLIDFVMPRNLQVIVPPPVKSATKAKEDKVDAEERDEEEDQQSHSESDIEPVITDGRGGVVLGRYGNLYILADPDLLNNFALKQPQNAASALALLDYLNAGSREPMAFDITLNGFGRTKSLLKLAFEPPFLAMTLALGALVIMLTVRAIRRFGAPSLRPRAIAFGKAALVDNTAMLVRKAGKARLMGGRYATVMREQAAQAFGVSPRLGPVEVDAYLDGIGNGPAFTELAARAEDARNDNELLAAARALHAWKRERLSEN